MFTASLPREKKIAIADLLAIIELQIDAEVVMKEGSIEGVMGVLRGTIDITLPAIKNIGDASIVGWVSFNTITKHYVFVIEDFLFTNEVMTLKASGELVIGTENTFLYFEGTAVITPPGIVSIKAEITRGLLLIKKPENAGYLPVFEIDFVVKIIELPGGAYVEDAHLNVDVFVDAAGAVSMRCDVNGTIGIGKNLPQAFGDIGVSAYVEAKMRIDNTGVTLSEDIKVVLTVYYENKDYGFKLEGKAKFLLPSPDRITFVVTCTLDNFAGEISGEMEATITVFIHEDVAAARAILGDDHPTVRKLLAIDGDGAFGDFYSASDSAGARRHALAIAPAAPAGGSGSSEPSIIPFAGSNSMEEASLGLYGVSQWKGGPCDWMKLAPIQYLVLQQTKCNSGWGMYGFRFQHSGCERSGSWIVQHYGLYFRSISMCTKMSSAGVPLPFNGSVPGWGCSDYYTGWKDINQYGGAMVNIAKFAGEVECPRDQVMSGWKFRTANWQRGRIEFKCCKTTLPLGEIKAVYGNCDQGGNSRNKLEYLDRHSPTCPSGNVMTGWAISSSGCSGSYVRARASCVEIPVPPPPSPHPPPPPPPRPPWSPPPPRYLQNGVPVKVGRMVRDKLELDRAWL